jgi:hypothetical protein
MCHIHVIHASLYHMGVTNLNLTIYLALLFLSFLRELSWPAMVALVSHWCDKEAAFGPYSHGDTCYFLNKINTLRPI